MDGGNELKGIEVPVIRMNPRAILPKYMTVGAAGCDVYACLEGPLTLESLERSAVPTGIAVEIPPGFEIQVRPRSGLAIKQGLTMINAPGTIDSDYRGEIKVLMVNLGRASVTLAPGDRVAQLVLSPVFQMAWNEVDALTATNRADGGFGSTGHSRGEGVNEAPNVSKCE